MTRAIKGQDRSHIGFAWLAALGSVALLAACSVAQTPASHASGSAIPWASPPSTSGVPTASTSPPTPSPSAHATAYIVRWQNDDDVTYHVELIENPPASVLGIFHPWTIGPGQTGVVEISSTFPGELQVRQLPCGAVASWTVQPGSYDVLIRGGKATLQPYASLGSLVPLPTASTCIFSGP